MKKGKEKEHLTVLIDPTLGSTNYTGKELTDFFQKLGFQKGTLYLSNPTGEENEFVIESNYHTEPIYASVVKEKEPNSNSSICLKTSNLIKKVEYINYESYKYKSTVVCNVAFINPKENSIIKYQCYNGSLLGQILSMENDKGEKIEIIADQGLSNQFFLDRKNALAEKMIMLSFPVDPVAILQMICEILQHKLKAIPYLGIKVKHQKDAKYSEEEIVIKNGVWKKVSVTQNDRKMEKTNGAAWNLKSQGFSIGTNEQGNSHYQITNIQDDEIDKILSMNEAYEMFQNEVQGHTEPIRKRIASILEEQK